MKIFDLEAVVKIVTGGADKQLESLEKKGISLDNSMTKNFKSIGAEVMKLAGPAILGALGAALASIGAAAVKLGTELADAMQIYQVETGASAAETEIFAQQLTALWQNNTDGVQDITDSLVAMRRAFGELGDDTQRVTQDILNFGKITGTDAATAAKLSAAVVRQYGLELEDLPQVLDTVARTQQLTGASSEKLLDSLRRTSPIVQTLGLSVQEASAFFGVLERNGAGAESSYRTLIQILEASTNTTERQSEAFKTLGIAVDEAGAPIGGAASVFRQLIPQLEKGEVKGDKLAAALEILGKRGGQDLVAAMKSGVDGIDDLSKAITDSEGTVIEASDTFDRQIGERIPLLFKKAFGDSISAAARVGTKAIGWVLDALDWVISRLQDVGTFAGATAFGIENNFRVMAGTVTDVFNAIADNVLDVFRYVVDQINGAIDALPSSLQNKLGDVRSGLGSFREQLGESQDGTVADALFGRAEDFVHPLEEGRAALERVWDEQNKAKESYKELKAEVSETPALLVETAEATKDVSKEMEEAKRKAEQLAKEQARAAEEAARANEQLRIAIIRSTQGETAAKLAELEIQKKNYEKAGADKLAIDRWYAEESKRIRDEARTAEADEAKRMSDEQFAMAQQAAKLDADLLEARGQTLEATLAHLDAELEAFIRAGNDKVKAEELFAKKREDVIKKHADATKKIEEDLVLKTMEARGDTEEAENLRRLAQIRETVEAARAAGVDEVKIAEYIAAEQKRIRDGAKAEEKQNSDKGASADPRMSAEDAFAGVMQGLSFSIGGGKKPKSDPASTRAANELAAQVGQLANGNSASGSLEGKTPEQVLVIRIEDSSGQVLSTNRLSGAEADEVIQDYELGGL